MVAKKPDERYQTMDEVIRALEDFLGVSATGPFTPKEEHVKVLEFAVERFNTSGWSVLRKQLIMGFFFACAVAIALLAWLGHPKWAAAGVGFVVLTTLVYQITLGITQATHLFRKFRQLIFGSGIVDWLTWIAIVGLSAVLLVVVDWHWPWLVVLGAAVVAVLGFHLSVDLMLSKDRNTPLTQTEAMLKQMRLRGLDEKALRQFVCRFSGKDWEEFYEALFGYEAKLQRAADVGQRRPRGASERSTPLGATGSSAGSNIASSSAAKCGKPSFCKKSKPSAPAAKGISETIAKKQAKQNAARVVASAAKLKQLAARRAAETVAPQCGCHHEDRDRRQNHPARLGRGRLQTRRRREEESRGR